MREIYRREYGTLRETPDYLYKPLLILIILIQGVANDIIDSSDVKTPKISPVNYTGTIVTPPVDRLGGKFIERLHIHSNRK